MFFPWERELASYDTVAKLIPLMQSLDLDPDYHLAPYRFVRLCQEDGTYKRLNIEPFTEDEITKMEVDVLRSRIWEEFQIRREKRKLEKLIFGGDGNKHWFVTIGLDDKQFKDDNEAMIINPLVKKLIDTPGFDDVRFVVEKFRINDDGDIYIHRHIHMVFDSSLRKSKIVQFCFQKAKKYVAGSNFIDVKPDPDRVRDKYIKGEKKDIKIKCVEMDRSWRKEKKIIEGE